MSDTRRPYTPPVIERVLLRGEDAVLAACKVAQTGVGPVITGCASPGKGNQACKGRGNS